MTSTTSQITLSCPYLALVTSIAFGIVLAQTLSCDLVTKVVNGASLVAPAGCNVGNKCI